MSRALLATMVALFLVAATDVGSAKKSGAKAAARVPTVVNLNTATATQIATLPGIGEKAAERIIEYREKNGGFKKIEELMNVIRPAGLHTQKAPRIQATLRKIREERGDHSLEFLGEMPPLAARDWLTSIPGIGKKTA